MAGRPTLDDSLNPSFNKILEPIGVSRILDSKSVQPGGSKVPDVTGYQNIYNGVVETTTLVEDGSSFYCYKPEQLSYAPSDFRNKYILPGWNPATILLANSEGSSPLMAMLQESVKVAPAQAKEIYEIGILLKILALITPNSTVWRPAFSYTDKLGSGKYYTVPGTKYSYTDALAVIYSLPAKVIPLSSPLSGIDVAKMPFYSKWSVLEECIKRSFQANNSAIVPVFKFTDIIQNWNLLSARPTYDFKEFELNDPPKYVRAYPLPANCCTLTVQGTNVNVNSKPAKGNSIGKVNTGDTVIQIGGVTNGFVNVQTSNGQSGWISAEYLKTNDSAYDNLSVPPSQTVPPSDTPPTPPSDTSSGGGENLPTSTKTDLGKPDDQGAGGGDKGKETGISTTTIVIGVGSLIAVIIAIMLLRSKKK